MWHDGAPHPEDELRQGDLLENVLLPKLKRPFRVAHVPGADPQGSDPMLISGSKRQVLVVSQCCDIAEDRYVAVAPIRQTGRLNDRLRRALLADVPPDPEELAAGDAVGYVFDQFRLAPLDGVIDDDGELFKVADFGMMQTLTGEVDDLREHRSAAMTPAGRRLLRIKLSYFWSRPEASDAEELAAQGLPPGEA